MASSTQFHESVRYTTEAGAPSHRLNIPRLLELCPELNSPQTRVLDIGCGNGSVAARIVKSGCTIVGIDLSEYGIQIAKEICPAGRFEVLPANAEILENLGEKPFDVVYSLEVIEHLYDPRGFLAGCFAATRSGGTFVCSTPYHGYLKNLAIAVMGKWDSHANPTWDGGHIKLFSRATLSALMEETGFRNLRFSGVGRYPYLWKSMLIAGTKP